MHAFQYNINLLVLHSVCIIHCCELINTRTVFTSLDPCPLQLIIAPRTTFMCIPGYLWLVHQCAHPTRLLGGLRASTQHSVYSYTSMKYHLCISGLSAISAFGRPINYIRILVLAKFGWAINYVRLFFLAGLSIIQATANHYVQLGSKWDVHTCGSADGYIGCAQCRASRWAHRMYTVSDQPVSKWDVHTC